MAAPDFPASPTVGQTYTAPNGIVYTWDGAVWTTTGAAAQSAYWTDTGAELKPTSAGREVQVPGDTSGAQVILGPTTGTTRGRLSFSGAGNKAGLFVNRDWTASNVQDDATQPSWGIQLGPTGDNLTIQRSPAGSTAQ